MKQSLELRLDQSTRLSHEQRLQLKQLLRTCLELRAAAPPEARKGLDGIGHANTFLAERNLRGILIGSLATDVWKTADPHALLQHKDVDVAVLPPTSGEIDIEPFEKGIDWWLPHTEQLTIRTDFTKTTGDMHWWENGNGVVIGFGLEYNPDHIELLPVGLSIPTPEWLINMRIAETLARTDVDKVEVSHEALAAFGKKLSREMNSLRLTPIGVVPLKVFAAYRYHLGLHKLSDDRTIPLNLNGLSLNEIVAINSRTK